VAKEVLNCAVEKVQDCIPGRQCGTRQTTVVSLIAYLSPHLSKGFHALLEFLFHLGKFGVLLQLLVRELELLLHRQTFLFLQLRNEKPSSKDIPQLAVKLIP
jgi:hypothetical protein